MLLRSSVTETPGAWQKRSIKNNIPGSPLISLKTGELQN